MIRMPHRLAIERTGTPGAEGEYGQPAVTYSTVATVRGWVQPKDAEEMSRLSQQGPVISTHTIYMRPTDIHPADRIRFDPYDGRRYEITGVRDEAGIGHHYRVDARMVQ